MSYENDWALAWGQSSDVNIATQVQDVTAFNGAGNVNGGDFSVAVLQNAGDSTTSSSEYGEWGDVNVGTQVQNVTAFNGAGNVNGGDFNIFAGQNVGDSSGGPVNDYGVDVNVDLSNGVNVGVQVQNVTAFNGTGNVNGANFEGGADQGAGDAPPPPPADDMCGC